MNDSSAPGTLKIFVSYTWKDEAWALWIASVYRDAGHETTIQCVDFRPGNNFVAKMQAALNEADHTIAVLSPDYEASAFASAEWLAAFRTDPLGESRRLIPIRVTEYQPSGLLGPIVRVDVFDIDEDTAKGRVLGAMEPADPSRPAPFPGIASRPASGSSFSPPVPTVPNFTGRQEILGLLAERLGSDPPVTVALTGVGGVGKTSIVREHVRSGASAGQDVLWVHAAETPAAIQELVAHLDVSPEGDIDSLRLRIRVAAQSRPELLVVLDGAEGPNTLADVGLDTAPRVVITSRAAAGWGPAGVLHVAVEPWSVQEGREFLRRSAPAAPDAEVASELAALLGQVPLALAQAAAYVDQHRLSFSDYIERLHLSPHTVLSHLPHGSDSTVLSTLDLSLAKIQEDSSSAVDLLRLLSFCAEEPVPRAVFLTGSNEIPDGLQEVATDPFEFDHLVAVLLDHSLVASSGDGLHVHPLVAALVRLGLDEDQAGWAQIALRVMADASPFSAGGGSWPTWNRLGPHIVRITDHLTNLNAYEPRVTPLAEDLAEALRSVGYEYSSMATLERALGYEWQHLLQTQNATRVAGIHNALGTYYMEMRHPDLAIPHLRTELAIDEASERSRSVGSALTRVTLASALLDLVDNESAREELTVATEIVEASCDDLDPQRINLYGTWGRLSVASGDLSAAEDWFQRTLDLAGAVDDTPWRAILTMLHLGNVRMEMRDFDGALELYEAGSARMQEVDSSDPLYADLLGSRANTLIHLGRLNEARPVIAELLQVTAPGPEGLVTLRGAQALTMLGRVLYATGDQDRAVEILAKALSTMVEHLPPWHDHTQQVAHHMARALSLCEADAWPDARALLSWHVQQIDDLVDRDESDVQ